MKRFARWMLLALAVLLGSAAYAQAPAAPSAVAPPLPGHFSGRCDGSHAGHVEGQGRDGTVYLLGSIHVMKKDVHWETAGLKDALGASDVLYLEVTGLDEASMQAAQPAILQLGSDPEHGLSTKISKEDATLLDAAVKSMGLPGAQAMEPLQPWLVQLMISVLPAVQAGYDLNSGVDKKLEAEVKQTGKPVKGFETVTEQMHYMADMPAPLQAQMLHQTLVDLPKSVSQTDAMVADWTRGDVEAIAKLDNDEMKVKYPELYDKLLVKRNERFAEPGRHAERSGNRDGLCDHRRRASGWAGQRGEDARSARLHSGSRGVALRQPHSAHYPHVGRGISEPSCGCRTGAYCTSGGCGSCWCRERASGRYRWRTGESARSGLRAADRPQHAPAATREHRSSGPDRATPTRGQPRRQRDGDAKLPV